MDDDIIIKILKPVNSLPDLNQWNVISKIQDESYAQYKAGNHIYYEISRALEGINYDFCYFSFPFRLGRTLLHYAAKGGCEKVADALIKRGGNVSEKDRWGYTPLDLAIESGNGELVELLRMKLLEKEAEALAKKRSSSLSKDSCSKTPKSPGTNGDITKSSEEAKEMQLKTNKAIAIGAISGSLTALACAIIATALFATGIIAVETLTVLAAISIVAVVGLAVGKVTYVMSKPNTETNEVKLTGKQEELRP